MTNLASLTNEQLIIVVESRQHPTDLETELALRLSSAMEAIIELESYHREKAAKAEANHVTGG